MYIVTVIFSQWCHLLCLYYLEQYDCDSETKEVSVFKKIDLADLVDVLYFILKIV